MNDWKKEAAIERLRDELAQAMEQHHPLRSHHEAYGVLAEEFAEYFSEVRQKVASRELLETELLHIAATAIRAIIDL